MHTVFSPWFRRYAARLLRSSTAQGVVTFCAVSLLTLLLLALDATLHPVTAALLYILAVLLSAVAFGLWMSLAVAILTSLIFTFFFVPPYGSLGLSSPESFVRLSVFLSVALLVSGLAGRARSQTLLAQLQAAQLNALYQLSQALSAEVERDRILPIITGATTNILDVRACHVLLADADVSHASAVPTPPGCEDVPLLIEQRYLGVLRITRRLPNQPLTPDERELLAMIAAQVSTVLERVRLTELAGQARALAESDRLKSTLLSLVSHDLRTPLAVIKGLATSLLDAEVDWSAAQRRELLTTIDSEANRLNRVVSELLEMSRIEAGVVSAVRSWQPLDELLTAVVEDFRNREPNRQFRLDLPHDLPWVQISYAQIEHVLRNLLENALHYGPADSAIEVCAGVDDGQIWVQVADYGPGVPEALRERIFEKFVRAAAAERHATGTGLGLAICKGLIEAHGGRIGVADRPGGGALFTFSLPLGSLHGTNSGGR